MDSSERNDNNNYVTRNKNYDNNFDHNILRSSRSLSSSDNEDASEEKKL